MPTHITVNYTQPFAVNTFTIIVSIDAHMHSSYNHSHKKHIVWKHGPNQPFYALMLRTKLYWNPFFFTRHQNVNKPKSRAARTVHGLIFLPFYKTIRLISRCKQNKIKLCYNRLQFVKETQTITV